MYWQHINERQAITRDSNHVPVFVKMMDKNDEIFIARLRRPGNLIRLQYKMAAEKVQTPSN